MLWEAINKVEVRFRNGTEKITAYQSRIESLKKTITKLTTRIEQAKRENLSLQHSTNKLLLVRLNEYS